MCCHDVNATKAYISSLTHSRIAFLFAHEHVCFMNRHVLPLNFDDFSSAPALVFPTTSLVTLADAEHHEYIRPKAVDTRRSTPGEAEAGADEPKLWPMPITNLKM